MDWVIFALDHDGSNRYVMTVPEKKVDKVLKALKGSSSRGEEFDAMALIVWEAIELVEVTEADIFA